MSAARGSAPLEGDSADTTSRRGLFVVLEGVDGAGTTTQAARLAARLRDHGERAAVTREPSDGPIGTLIRLVLSKRIALAGSTRAEQMALLFAADRLDHVAHDIEPRLREGVVVISDRYDLSSLVYQSATAGDSGDALAFIRDANRYARRPDLTLVVHVPTEVAARRRRERGQSEELYEEAALQARLCDAYARAASFVPGDRIAIVDGVGTVDEVLERLWAELAPLLSSRS
jgi:dTMP kinase